MAIKPKAFPVTPALIRWRPRSQAFYSTKDLATVWQTDTATIRDLFEWESGVLRLGQTATRFRRGHITIRIPEAVAVRVQQQLILANRVRTVKGQRA
jgi:hypothetical protein